MWYANRRVGTVFLFNQRKIFVVELVIFHKQILKIKNEQMFSASVPITEKTLFSPLYTGVRSFV